MEKPNHSFFILSLFNLIMVKKVGCKSRTSVLPSTRLCGAPKQQLLGIHKNSCGQATNRSALEKREECGVAAIILEKKGRIASEMYNALLALQHRGQDSTGMAVYSEGQLKRKRGIGLVSKVFEQEDVNLEGKMAIGHTRYPTSGVQRTVEDVQPLLYENLTAAHNGHISNYSDVKSELEEKGYEFKGNCDCEGICYLLDYELKNSKGNVEIAVRKVMETLEGSYSVVAIYEDILIVFRDPFGIRPLEYGKRGKDYCFASESVVFDVCGFEQVGTVLGGELVIIKDGKIEKKRLIEKPQKNCMFEYVYFSRPDSVINGMSVHEVRKKLGEVLADEHPIEADVIVPIPDTGRSAVTGFSKKSGIPYDEGLIKNRYIGRTFIMSTQEERVKAVKTKLNPMRVVVAGKRVVLIDDSIVRGTTMQEIVRMVRGAGAKEIHLRITCPPIKAPCFYGVDMPTYKELIAHEKTVEETRKFLGADSLGYVSIEGLKKVLGNNICTACLNEEYHSEYVKKMAKEAKKKGLKYGSGCC